MIRERSPALVAAALGVDARTLASAAAGGGLQRAKVAQLRAALRAYGPTPAVGALSGDGGAPPLGIGPTAPQTPPKGPSDDAKYLGHAFEPQQPVTMAAWDVQRIRVARDAHAQGTFEASALLADAMLTDPRILAGLLQRLGPLLGIPREVKGGPRWNGKGLTETVRAEAEQLFAPEAAACPPGTLAAGFVSTAMMGVTILQNVWRPREDASRMDVETRPWPMQLCRWNEALHRYQVDTTEGLWTVEPNDGKWIVIEPIGPRSFLFGALRALALTWADRAYAIRDRSNHSAAHGTVGIVGTPPEGVATDGPDGQKFKAAIMMLHRARGGLVKPFGSTVDTFEPKSLAWQIFGQIVNSTNADIMLALNGLDGSTVYKPISQIDGVRYDLVRLELGAATVQYNAGLLLPWTLYNFGDAALVPKLGWLVPDPREQERLDALGRRHLAFTTALEGYRDAGVLIDQGFVDLLAQRFGVDKVKLAPTPPALTTPPVDPNTKPEPTPAADFTATKKAAAEAA